jgi:DNA (cytosine-5)-methyltransferase 1
MNYYNEFDPYAAQWLRNLIDAGHLPKGEVDSRSIKDVKASELTGYTQCHFFAGLGGWSHALRLAGWPEDRPVWTGSCPCQPLAQPAKVRALLTSGISGLSGSTSSASADLTLSLVSKLKQRLTTDGSTLFKLTWREKVTPAGRLVYRLAASGRRTSDNDFGSWPTSWASPRATDPKCGGHYTENCEGGEICRRTQAYQLADTQHTERGAERQIDTDAHGRDGLGGRGDVDQLADDLDTRLQGRLPGGAHEERQDQPRRIGRGGAINFWSDCDWLPCRDGKARPVEPGTFPLAHGVSARVGRLRAYGNAIVPQVAQTFIEAYLES